MELNLTNSILGFIFVTLTILFSGTRLAKYGDLIAELSGWGKAWVGLILMSAVTSLPELITGISSVNVVGEPDLALGDILGSCVFNLLILTLMDFQIKKPLTSLVKTSHLFAGLFSIILISFAGVAILTNSIMPPFMWISPLTPILIFIYLISVKSIHAFDKVEKSETASNEQHKPNPKELNRAIKLYIVNALIVIGASIFLPIFGEKISEQSGLGHTFFGTLFLAASTSLPEIVVSIAAVRMLSYDLAIGNVMGSNIFNIFILALDDIVFTKGSLFADVNPSHLVSVFFVIVMSSVAGLGLMVKPTKRFFNLGIDTAINLILYLILLVMLYNFSRVS